MYPSKTALVKEKKKKLSLDLQAKKRIWSEWLCKLASNSESSSECMSLFRWRQRELGFRSILWCAGFSYIWLQLQFWYEYLGCNPCISLITWAACSENMYICPFRLKAVEYLMLLTKWRDIIVTVNYFGSISELKSFLTMKWNHVHSITNQI